jgi:hypothetical protein
VIAEFLVFDYFGSLQGDALCHDQILNMMQDDLQAVLGYKRLQQLYVTGPFYPLVA